MMVMSVQRVTEHALEDIQVDESMGLLSVSMGRGLNMPIRLLTVDTRPARPAGSSLI